MQLVSKIKVFTIIVLLLMIFNNKIFAVNAEEIESNTNYACEVILKCQGKTKLSVGEKTEIEIESKNINIQNGIVMYNATVQYDSEKIDVEILDSEEWEVYYQKNKNVTLVRKDLENSSNDETMGKIIVTAKTDVDINSIRLINGEVTDGEETYEMKDTSLINIEYSTEEITKENIIVQIKSEKIFKGMEGWKLSTDKKILTKEYQENIKEDLIVYYEDGEEVAIAIEISNIDKKCPEIKGVEEGKVYTGSVMPEVIDENLYDIDLIKDSVTIEYNNREVITEEGNYTIYAIDLAGNVTEVNFTIRKNLSSIAITKAPTETNYIEGENFDATGMKVTAIYNNGTTAEITNYIVKDGNNLTKGKTSVTISYTEGEITKTATQAITVSAKELSSIAITKAPTKINYIEGENFDATGMKVTATYNNGTTAEVTNYTVEDGNNLTAGKTSVTISYTEGEITKTATQAITVSAKEETLKIEVETYEKETEENVQYIKNIKPRTTIAEIKENIKTNGTTEVYKGTEKITDTNAKIGTGMTIKITLNGEKEEYTVVVTGDLDGDGNMGDIDLLRLARYNAGIDKNLKGAYLKGANIFKDNNYADDKDLLKMARVLVGLDNL